jgi:nickel-dependent lactate racemase
MVDVWLPYGKSEVCMRVPTRNFLGSIQPNDKTSVPDSKAEVERALKEPIGTKRLAEIVKPEQRVAIVVDEAARTRDVMLLPILNELKMGGVKDEDVTVVLACDETYNSVKREEAVRLLGEEVLNRVKIVSHDCKAQDVVFQGTTKRGTKVYLNRVFAEADVRILSGKVGFHCYAGYDGGRTGVLPGIAGEETIKHNHAFLLDSNARPGVLIGNPVHEDMVEAAGMAKVDFILNVVTDGKGEVVRAFAGDLEQAFNEAVKLVDEIYRIAVDRRADIVVASAGGSPADTNLSRACLGLNNALEVVKRGGVIILVAECPEGFGDQTFYEWMVGLDDLKSVEREIRRDFALGGHMAYYLLKALQSHQVILVSSMPDYYATSIFKLKTTRAVNDSLNEAFNVVGRNGRVWAMPYGNCTLLEVKVSEEQIVALNG